jgi:hypothetical protein
MSREGDVVVLRWEGTMGSAVEARALAKGFAKVKKKAVEALGALPKRLQITLAPGEVATLRKTLEGATVDVRGQTVRGSLSVSREAMQVLRGLVRQGLRRQLSPPGDPTPLPKSESRPPR